MPPNLFVEKFMKVRVIGTPVKGKLAKRLKNLSSKRIMNRQDGIDGQDFNMGPNRGHEAFFQK